MRNKKLLFRILQIIVIVLLIVKFLPGSGPNLKEAHITKVVDGDTVYTDKGKKIRIIGLNAPERGKEELAEEARERAEDLLLYKVVYLEEDIEKKDQYDRDLRYIWIEKPDNFKYQEIKEKNFSAILISEGLAKPYTFKPNDKYSDVFLKLGKEAKKNKTGMWELNEEGTTRGDI